MRDRYAEILEKGADVVAIGTGGRSYAQAFVEDENVPFPVYLDHDGTAARIVGTQQMSPIALASPKQLQAGTRAALKGHRQSRSGRRPFQLGATLVLGPGNRLRYADFEKYAGDHADIDEVLAAVGNDPVG